MLEINSVKLKELMESRRGDPDFSIIDVRTPQEFEVGHIAGAVNIDIYSAGFENEIRRLGKNKIYAIYCRTGSRSRAAAEFMTAIGFPDVFDLSGGTIAWAGNSLPLLK